LKYLSLTKIIKLLLTVIVLGVLINILEYEKLINEYKKADLFYLFIATFSVPFIIGFRSLKWKILLQSYWDEITIVDAITSYLSGFAIGILTPARVGEFTRTIFLPNKDKVKVVNLVLLDRYCELVIMIFLIIPGSIHYLGIKTGVFIFVLGMLGLLFFVLYPRLIEFINSKNLKYIWLNNIFKRLVGLNNVPMNVILTSLLLSLIIFVFSITTSYLLLSSFTTINILDAFKVFPLTLFTNIIPITVGNLGVREGATIFLLNEYGVTKEIAFNISIMLFFLHSFLPAVLGLIIIQIKSK